jgi:hypothetical protein
VNAKRWKLMSAAAGAGSILAMGGLTVAFSGASLAQPEPAPPGPVTTSEISTGETSTESLAPTEAETTVFTPEVTVEKEEG